MNCLFSKEVVCSGCLQKFMEYSKDAQIVIDEEGKVLLFNKSAELIFRLDKNKIIGNKLDILFEQEMVHKHQNNIANYYSGRGLGVVGRTVTLNTKDQMGREIVIELSLSEIKHQSRRLLMADIREVTEAVNYKVLLESVFKDVGSGVVVYDRELKYLAWNPFMEKMTGYKQGELLGKKCYEVFPFLLESGIVSKLQKVFSGETVEVNQIKFSIPEKDKHGVFKAIYSPFKKNDEITGVIGLITDITSEYYIQEENKKLEIKLRQAQKMEALGTFAGGIAHNFNNVLGAIVGYAELTMDVCLDKKSRNQNLIKIINVAMRGSKLVKQIMESSRKTDTGFEVFSVSQLLHNIIEILENTVMKDIEIQQYVEEGVYMNGNLSSIETAIINICNNACRAMPDGGMLKIKLEQFGDDFLRILIADTGVGIPKENLDKIFDIFFTTRDIGQGTGLGLWTVYDIIQNKHKGLIEVSSEVGKGTEFSIILPRTTKKSIKNSQDKVSSGVYNGQVLIVDDEISMLDIARQYLEKIGFRVAGFSKPYDALKYFEKFHQELSFVITDYSMPLISGKKLAKKFFEINHKIPIVICSGYSDEGSDFVGAGISALLNKPYTKEELIMVINKII